MTLLYLWSIRRGVGRGIIKIHIKFFKVLFKLAFLGNSLAKKNNKGKRGYWGQKKDYASDIINWPEDYESGV